MQNDSYFIRHRVSIIIILVIIFVALGLFFWINSLKNGGLINPSSKSGLTQEQIQAIISDVPTGPETVSNQQRATILNDNATSSETLTPAQRASILNDNPR